MASRPRYQFAFPYYRPEIPDDHYRNNVFLERAFNALPLPKIWYETRTSNVFGLVVGDEIPDVSLAVPSEVGEQFVIQTCLFLGLSSNSTSNVPSNPGERATISLYVRADGAETQIQRIADWTVPSAGAASFNQARFDTTSYYKSHTDGVLRFYWKVSSATLTYPYIAASATVPTTMLITSYGID